MLTIDQVHLELFGPETGSLLIPVAVEDAPGVVVVDDRRLVPSSAWSNGTARSAICMPWSDSAR